MGKYKIKNRAIFFDRDGVLNEVKLINNKPHPPQNLNEMKLIYQSKNLITKLKGLGYYLICVTNQPDYQRGSQKKKVIESLNNHVKSFFKLDDIFTCWHSKDGICNCRKPMPGLIIEASKKYNIETKKSYLIGDRYKDIRAGINSGCKTIFINYNYNETKPKEVDFIARSTNEAIIWIIKASQI